MTIDEYITLIEEASVYDVASETPLEFAPNLSARLGNRILMKREDLQQVFSFKLRGAYNKLATLSQDALDAGIICSSAGNHAQGVALAAQRKGVRAVIVMPVTTPSIKIDAVKALGGEVVLHGDTYDDAYARARELEKEQGLTFIHPFNDPSVIAGQGTIGREIVEQLKEDIQAVFVPVGGGGLIAGTALAAQYFSNNCKVIGGEPFAVDDAYRSLQSGVIESNESTNTIADGLKTELGDINFPIIQNHVERIIRVTEEEIEIAMRLIWERMKIIAEPSGAVSLAAVIKEKEVFKNKKIGVIISGGNVDLNNLPF